MIINESWVFALMERKNENKKSFQVVTIDIKRIAVDSEIEIKIFLKF